MDKAVLMIMNKTAEVMLRTAGTVSIVSAFDQSIG